MKSATWANPWACLQALMMPVMDSALAGRREALAHRLANQRHRRGKHGQVEQVGPYGRGRQGRTRLHGQRADPGQDCHEEKLHDGQRDGVILVAVVAQAHDVQRVQQAGQQRQRFPSAQGQIAGEGDQSDAHHAHDGGAPVVERRGLAVKTPGHEGDDHAVHRREESVGAGAGLDISKVISGSGIILF